MFVASFSNAKKNYNNCNQNVLRFDLTCFEENKCLAAVFANYSDRSDPHVPK